MQKQFELWLDESGKFENESQLRQLNFKPSLIGGILLEKEDAEKIVFGELIDEKRNHAMFLSDDDKREYVLPVLEKMQTVYHGRQVFFENTEYEDAATNRQLYLRIMAEGLLQLLQTLNAIYESVYLEVIIAQRQDVTADAANQKIREQEYVNALLHCIEEKKKARRILLHEDCRLFIAVQAAHKLQKLQLADFACNTRLTRDSNGFTQVKERVYALYRDAYLFTLHEMGSENFIRRSLSHGYLSDAIMELYTTRDELAHELELKLILDRMKHTNYRLVKSQLKQCAADIIAYTQIENDYEMSESIIQKIDTELVPLLLEHGQPCLSFRFVLFLQLADSFLREGDVLAAKDVLCRCRHVQEQMGNHLEDVLPYYQLLEKEALLAINEFDFERGRAIMSGACDSFRGVMTAVEEDFQLKKRFRELRSEYYGDALCMQIYAMLFQQRHNPELYGKLCELSDIAMTQYPDIEGELERHRQYRSRIELENGNYEEALIWLYKAITFEYQQYNGKKLGREAIIDFLNRICDTENEESCRYYLMYYLLILNRAAGDGEILADEMYEALQEQETLLHIGELDKEESPGEPLSEVDIEQAKDVESGVSYHPASVVTWKYASYLYKKGQYARAYGYFLKVMQMCFRHENYLTMYLSGIGIAAEAICCLVAMKNRSAAKNRYEELLKHIEVLLGQPISSATREFVNMLSALLKESRETDGSLDTEKLMRVADRITY